MKICVLTHTFPRSNQDVTAAFMKEFCDGLAENKAQVFVVTPYDSNFRRQGDKFKTFTYKYIWPDQLHILGYSRTMEADVSLRKRAFFLMPFMILFGTMALYKVVKKNKIDIINVHWIIPNGLIALFVSKLTGVPYVVTLPGTDAYLSGKYKIIGWVAKLIANNSSGIFSNSSFHLKTVLSLGVNPKIQSVISYPVDVSHFHPSNKMITEIRKKHNLKKNDLVILAVGRLVYKKGFDYLIKAMKLLEDDSTKLLIAGEGDTKDEWQKLTKKLGLQEKVLFIGNIAREEIAYYYNLSDVFVAPSIVDKAGNVDGGPVVCFESMACGKPQVVTKVLGVADVISDNVHGFIVPQKDSKALANALQKLIKSKTLRIQMGSAARKLVNESLTTKSIGRKYLELFSQAI